MADVSRVLTAVGGGVKTAYGVGALVAPDAMSRRLAPDVRGHRDGRMNLRGFGGALTVLGSATVCTAVRGGDVRPILALNLAGELGDTAAGLLEWRDRGRADALVVGSLARSAAGIATWIAALRTASRQS